MIELSKFTRQTSETQASAPPAPSDAGAPKKLMNILVALVVVLIASLCIYALCRFFPVGTTPCLMTPEAAGECG